MVAYRDRVIVIATLAKIDIVIPILRQSNLEGSVMKDVSDFFVWVWSLIQTAAHYAYETAVVCITIIQLMYTSAYQYMSETPSFQSVPHLGKVMLSGIFAGLVPLILLAIIRSVLPAFIRGHLQDSGLASLVGAGGSSGSGGSTVSLRPYVTFSDPSIRILDIRQRSGNSWSADLEKNGSRQNLFIGSGSADRRHYISAFGSQGEVNWGN